ncbi:RNA polymerase sigma factor SigM [Nocardia sp. NPDC088792]|uniref:RNA polymerase sigma factor SigM n=1 Tax=Nocardia sp. NPDC088792 TaxID=3364332 RepID=UPI00381DBF88
MSPLNGYGRAVERNARAVATAVRPNLATSTDRELLAAHAAGERDAFAELFRRHRDHLYQVARRTCPTQVDAEDSVQEAMLSAHRNAAGFRGDAEVRSWLHRIVVNACLDRIRRNKLRTTVPLTEDKADEHRYDRDDYAALEATLLVDAALFTLPDEQRTALVAVELHGLTIAEAAERLGIPEGTVKSRCARARQRLTAHFQAMHN